MKKLSLTVLCVFTSLSALTAGELIKNGDFSQGADLWRGDAVRDVADSGNPLAPPSTSTSKGLVINLNPARWVKIFQDFTGNSDKLTIKVDYQLSANTAFSTEVKDYSNVTHDIGYNAWKPFHVPVGTWVMMMSDFGPDKGRYYMITPKAGVTDVQSFTVNPPGKDKEKKTLTFAFPPGTGTVTLLNVSVQD